MGNTFDMVVEKKTIHAMNTKLEIMSDYSNLITRIDKDSSHFLFIVKPIVDDEDIDIHNNLWQGGFIYLKKLMEKNREHIDHKLKLIEQHQINAVRKLREESVSANEKTRHAMKNQVKGLKTQI